jgi:alpha-beta hydrolase superfamily lysophospholipase
VSAGPRRFREQRWLVDESIRTHTIEFDQPRLAYHLGPVGDDLATADMTVIRNAVRKLADHVPVARGVAQRREKWARQAEDAGHPQTAAVHWYAAAQLWALACWPIWDDDALAAGLDDRKNAAYQAWAAQSGHLVERVDIPLRGGALAAWFHRPAGADGPLPTLLACGGMDSTRETLVRRAGDPWLARGFAVLAVDGPGQGESAIRGVHVTPAAWPEAGEAITGWLRSRPEVDDTRLVCAGTSFGSFWMTQVAATQPVFRGCSVALPVFEPGARTLFEQAAPTFKARHMWLAGLYHDEDAFDAMTPGYDLRPLITGMSVPWHIVGGGADELSPPSWVDEMARLCPAPVSRVSYAGARHSMTESPATALGPSWRGLAVDWLHDRVMGKPAVSHNRLVTTAGEVTDRE